MFITKFEIKIFWQLLKRSIIIATPTLSTRIINQIIWNALNIIIFTYVMPHLGLNSSFSTFMVLTMPVSSIFFLCIHQIYTLLIDITERNGNLEYELTLPISSKAIFLKYALEYAFISFISAIPLFFFGWILIQCTIPLTIIGMLKFYIISMLTALMSGFFTLLIASITKNLHSDLDNMWVRIIFPLWFLGCFQFSWHDLYKISPFLAYLNLLNPLTFALEGSRASIALEQSSLNWWYCVFNLIIFTLLFKMIAIKKLKKRLDCL